VVVDVDDGGGALHLDERGRPLPASNAPQIQSAQSGRLKKWKGQLVEVTRSGAAHASEYIRDERCEIMWGSPGTMLAAAALATLVLAASAGTVTGTIPVISISRLAERLLELIGRARGEPGLQLELGRRRGR